MMVKIVNTLGEVKTGVQGEAVYQGRYGQQIRRTRQPKRAIPSQKQLEHRQLYREALAWRKALSLPNRRYLDGYCISNWIVDDYKIPLPWSRFALKLYLQHIGFVIVDKPIMVYLPPYEDFVEEQTQHNAEYDPGTTGIVRVGQRLTIPNRKVIKLGFWLRKTGSPTGSVYFAITRWADKSLIVQQFAANAADVPTTPTYYEVEFTTPPTINEDVAIHTQHSVATIYNSVPVRWQTTDVKSGEWAIRYRQGAWGEYETYDTAYRYTYRVETPPPPKPDYENSTLGLLHVRHPALLSGEHRRDGKLLEEWTNLSSLDEEYLTGQVGIDVFSGDELKFATIAGVEYAFIVP
ncbi:hypothetical protein ES703_107887 [subsurface metagenome]